MQTSPNASSGAPLLAAIGLALLCSSALMIAAASGDLWLDEIWSVQLAGLLRHGAALPTVLRHDNNHTLNTLYLYFLGQPQAQLPYRLASVLSGMLFLCQLVRTAWRQWGARAALLAAMLAGTCFPILLYATEARGYALLMLLSVVAYGAWRRHLRSSGIGSLVLFWLASILGLLAHATFVVPMLAFGLGQLTMDRPDSPPAKRALALARVHLVPMLFTAWWYWFVLSRQVVGGGDPTGAWPIIGQAGALLLGLPDNALFRILAVLGIASLVAVGVGRLRKAGDPQWLFFLSVLLVAPAILLAYSHGRIFQVRYLAACFPFFVLLAAYLIDAGWSVSTRGGRALLLLVLAVFLAGNLQRDFFLLQEGRGGYSKAIAYMLRESPGPVLVASDHDFRNGMVLRFHAARLPGGERVHYVDEAQAPRAKPEWFLLHSQESGHVSPPQIAVAGVGVYQLVRSYGYAGLSGWNWYLYRRIA